MRGPFASLSIRGRLTAVLAATVLFTMVGSVLIWVASGAVLNDLAASSQAALLSTRSVNRLAQALSDEETGLRGYLLTADPTFLEPYTAGVAEQIGILGELDATTTRADVRTALGGVHDAIRTWATTYAEPTIAQVAGGNVSDARSIPALADGKRLFDNLRARIADLETSLGQPDTEVAARLSSISLIRTVVIIGLNVVLVLLLLGARRFLGRWIGDPIEGLVATAQRVETGADVPFVSDRRDEIGDLGAALERMRLRMQAAQLTALRSAEQSTVVNRFTELTGFLTTDALVAEAVLSALGELVKPDDGVVHISNRSLDRATPESAFGATLVGPLSFNKLAECPGVTRGSLYVTGNVAAPLAVRCPVYPATAGSVACIPLTALGEPVGAAHIHWDRPDALPADAASMVIRIAEHAALTIANRRLVAALQGMANTDARTGLLNTRAFDEALEAELGAHSTPTCSVLLLDIDHFKVFNDRYGHPAGDEALRTFAGLLGASVREGDVVSRYGGEEFAILLPNLGLADALVIAERIRARTESTIVPLAPGITGRLSVSIGVATAPDDGLDRGTILRAADTALYRAKTLGRNRVMRTPRPPDAGGIVQAS